LALAAESADDRCERDLDMDVTNFWKNVLGNEDEDVFDPNEYLPDVPADDSNSNTNNDNYDDNVDSNFNWDNGSEQEVGDQPGTVDANPQDPPPATGDKPDLDDDFFKVGNDDKFVLLPDPPASDGFTNDIDNDRPTEEQVDSWVDEVKNKENEGGSTDVTDEDGPGGNANLYQDDKFGVAQFPDDAFDSGDPVIGNDPFHHEAPDRAIVPNTKQSTDSETQGVGSFEIAAIILVLAMIVPVVAFLLHRRQRRTPTASTKNQQEIFQSTYKKAERKMLKEHRNLNYRNHSEMSPDRPKDAIDMALDELSYADEYTDEKFHDEEGGDTGGNSSDGEENGEREDEFVLDSNLLHRMN
jgi:hypothetical protein